MNSLNQQKINDHVIGSWRVVIVDNSPEFNCRSLLDDETFNYDYTMCHEPRSGIAYARNKGVSEAGDADFVVFVDDDEHVDDDWLMRLVDCQARTQCDVVQGPVVSVFKWPVKSWYYHFHQRPRRQTGELLGWLATGNAIVAMDVLRGMEGPFNPTTALMGGEDTLLGLQLTARGHSIVWCNEAVAYEEVPPQRATLTWCLRRSFYGGNKSTFIALFNTRSKLVYARRLVASFVCFLQGVLLLPSFILPIRTRLKGPCWIACGLGSFTGLFNHRCEQYKRCDATR